jgi:hypothetical protein
MVWNKISGVLVQISTFQGAKQYVSFASHMKTEADPVSETLRPLVFRIPDDGQSANPVIFRSLLIFVVCKY